MPRKADKRKQPSRPAAPQVDTAIAELAELQATVTLTPIELLGVMMKVVLEERITSEEIDRICTAYSYAMQGASRP